MLITQNCLKEKTTDGIFGPKEVDDGTAERTPAPVDENSLAGTGNS
jgi:hypothetical protein